jgi:asparaginyl-tRNA synthetase
MLTPRTNIKAILRETPGTKLTASGWVRTRRDSANVSFAALNDGSCLTNLQLVIEKGAVADELLEKVTTGACVTARGELVESPGKGQAVELKVSEIEVHGTADPAEYPLQKKRHSLEYLREIAHLRTRSNTFGAVFRVRHALSYAIHKFFDERGFVYVHTPIITASDAEGAGAMFGVTTLDLMNLPREGVDFSADFFGRPTYLTVSGQLEAEVFALTFSNCYTFGPTFRAENSNTPRHLAEFWMVEPEMAFCDLDGDVALAEEFLKYLIAYVMENCPEDLEFFTKWVDETVVSTLEHVLREPFERVTYTDAVAMLEKADRSFEYPVFWGMDIQTEHERYLTEEAVGRPIALTDFPKSIKPFYMRQNDDGKTVRALDVLVPRIGELIGGSQREERYDALLRAIREHGLPEEAYWWYLELRKFGSVPHAGFGLGFERMVMFATGMKNIRDVMPFPRSPMNAEF